MATRDGELLAYLEEWEALCVFDVQQRRLMTKRNSLRGDLRVIGFLPDRSLVVRSRDAVWALAHPFDGAPRLLCRWDGRDSVLMDAVAAVPDPSASARARR